jgi:hypothetical protein
MVWASPREGDRNRLERFKPTVAAMSTFLGIVITAVSICTFAVVIWVFIWAAKKDGERLGIRRLTRIGR